MANRGNSAKFKIARFTDVSNMLIEVKGLIKGNAEVPNCRRKRNVNTIERYRGWERLRSRKSG